METHLAPNVLKTSAGQRATEILRACVHCGFCNATCPTYQLLGDELDGPRGRIYLIKDVLESGEVNAVIGSHLDRCLTCRACETTCPSGVSYGELLEIGRELIEPQRPRSAYQKRLRNWLLRVVPDAERLRFWVRLGNLVRWLLPNRLSRALPRIAKVNKMPETGSHTRKVILLNGCVQSVVTPEVNQWVVQLLDAAGIEAVQVDGCCGALALHLGEHEQASTTMGATIDRIVGALNSTSESGSSTDNTDGVEAVISMASGCGVTVKDYSRLVGTESEYAERAAWVAQKTMDISEYLTVSNLPFKASEPGKRIAWQAPCSLQHGQKITAKVEQLLLQAGYELLPIRDSQICCGSAGTFSMLEPELSFELRANKLSALTEREPDVIVTANIGCQMHLQGGTAVPVKHWVELLTLTS